MSSLTRKPMSWGLSRCALAGLLLWTIPWVACGSDDADGPDGVETNTDVASSATCTVLFGTPNDKTGLTADQCQPRCDCEGKRFEPPVYTVAEMAVIEGMVHLEPMEPLTEDPYVEPELPELPEETVCAVLLDGSDPNSYRLRQYESPEAAESAGGMVTHQGPCGLCSPLQNLLVYMREPDLTDPVRSCALQGITKGEAEQKECLMALGFDEPCASIWFYNMNYTREKCMDICVTLLSAPYHNEDGSLNECLQCDEDNAGPIFKHYAGRTRRNTGLPSSMCRPCSEILPIVHRYTVAE